MDEWGGAPMPLDVGTNGGIIAAYTAIDPIVAGGRRLGEKGGIHGLRALYRIPLS